MKYGDASMADELFRTNVYYKSGDGYKEYTFPNLFSQKYTMTLTVKSEMNMYVMNLAGIPLNC